MATVPENVSPVVVPLVAVREVNCPDGKRSAGSDLQFASVPSVGDLLYVPADLCFEVTRVVHLASQPARLQIQSHGETHLPRQFGRVVAYVEVQETTKFKVEDLPDEFR